MIVKIVISLTNYTRTRLNPIKTCMSHVERTEEGSNCELCQLDEHKICHLKARKKIEIFLSCLHQAGNQVRIVPYLLYTRTISLINFIFLNHKKHAHTLYTSLCT